jgi:FkbM family methyltransferase
MGIVARKIDNAYTMAILGFSLGATVREKVRLTFFFLVSRMFHSRPTTRQFLVRMHGTPVHIRLRNNFADAYALDEAFRKDDYALSPAADPAVIFDLGANLGFVTLSFAVRYPHARIFCFEPDPENFAELIANTRAFPAIRCFPYAIGAKNEMRYFYKSPVFHMRNSLIARSGNDDRIEVNVISLDDAMTMTGVKHIDLMKFDVEGAEEEIFSSFTRFDAVGALVGEIHPYLWKGDEEKQLLAILQKHYMVAERTEHGKTFLTGTAL